MSKSTKEQSANQTGGQSEPAKTDNSHGGKIDPVTYTILPIADELLTFVNEGGPTDLSKWGSLHFEKLYNKLEAPKCIHWLGGNGFSYQAGKFEADFNSFLIRFRKWENELRGAGITSAEELSKLPDTNPKLRQELDEIYGDAKNVAKWLKDLVWMITQKRNDAKATKAAKGAGAGANETEELKPKYYIKKGPVWEICFDDESVFIGEKYKGLPLIAFLLQNPYENFYANKLKSGRMGGYEKIKDCNENIREEDFIEGGGGRFGEFIHYRKDARREMMECWDEKKRLQKKLKDPDNIDQKEAIERQIKDIDKEIKRRTNIYGHARPTAGDPYERARLQVLKRHDSIMKFLEQYKDRRKLYYHFVSSMKIGIECSYEPENRANPPAWEII
jgi:hypothetical protein